VCTGGTVTAAAALSPLTSHRQARHTLQLSLVVPVSNRRLQQPPLGFLPSSSKHRHAWVHACSLQ
jgi:hypothetical protein